MERLFCYLVLLNATERNEKTGVGCFLMGGFDLWPVHPLSPAPFLFSTSHPEKLVTRHTSLGAFASPCLPRDIAAFLCHTISISMILQARDSAPWPASAGKQQGQEGLRWTTTQKKGSPKGARKHQSNGWDRLGQLLHRFQNGVVVRLVGHFGHQLAVSQRTVGSHHEDGAGQQTQFLDQHAVVLA